MEVKKMMKRCIVRIETMNGKSISMGMSDSHYCGPRKNFDNFEGDYQYVELGYPIGFNNLKGVDSESDFDIYPWVSVDIVVSFIRGNGGLKNIDIKTPETIHWIPEKILDCWDYEGLMCGN